MDLTSARGFAERFHELEEDITHHKPGTNVEREAQTPKERFTAVAERVVSLDPKTYRLMGGGETHFVVGVFPREGEPTLSVSVNADYPYVGGSLRPRSLQTIEAQWSFDGEDFAAERVDLAEVADHIDDEDVLRRLSLVEESLDAVEAARIPA